MTKTFFHGYEKIVKQLATKSQLWEDPEFPAVQSSVFYHQTPPFEFAWKRPKVVWPVILIAPFVYFCVLCGCLLIMLIPSKSGFC